MSTFESKEVEVKADPATLQNFIRDPKNLYELLPKERIENWKADERSCSFKISGVSSMELQLQDSETPGQVKYRSGEKAPFPFELSIQISEKEGGSTCQVICEAELNPFLENMVQGPLERLFDHMAERINELDPGS